ncbi:unknown [Prevotella sp. CAG:924]|nr:unknown [Prevotella sp. CAG:924]
MCMGSHVGIDSEANVCCLAFCRSQLIDDFQLGHALHIETENIGIQSEIDFPISLADSGKHYFRSGEASLQSCFDLASADTIRTKPGVGNDAQHLRVGIGLNGIVYLKILVTASLGLYGV